MQATRILRPSPASSAAALRRYLTSRPAAPHSRLLFSSSPRRVVALANPSPRPAVHASSFSTSARAQKGLQPDSADPAPPKTEPMSSSGEAAQISDAEYHEIADQYLDTLVLAIEELSEANSEGVEVEFSAGVLTVTHPKSGTYVINKQPPNRQIWLSSPVSGPKRYDWVISGAAQHEKEGSAVDAGDDGAGGRWVYLRDGEGLSDLLKKELGVDMSADAASDAALARDGPAGGGSKLDGA